MKIIRIKQAEKNEINWINVKYSEVGFVKSNYENEYIIIAKIENENAGLGRLVQIDSNNIELGGIYVFPNFRGFGVAEKIVQHLCKENSFCIATIWCLPFENLSNFYLKFGFQNCKHVKIPEKITQKLKWCNSESKYDEKVLLLCKTSKM